MAAANPKQTAEALRALLTPAVEDAGFDLEDVSVSRAGARSVVRVAVDRDGGVDLDAVADATRAINVVLDANEDAVPGAYALEVTSPGVDRPLTLPRHWRRNLGRLVDVATTDGGAVSGRLTEATETGATVGGTTLDFEQVRRAVVRIEFTRPGETAADAAQDEQDEEADE